MSSILNEESQGAARQSLGGLLHVVNTVDALRRGPVTDLFGSAITLGSATVGDGGGATYYWNPTDTTADNGTTVIRPFVVGTGAGRWNILTTSSGGIANGSVTPPKLAPLITLAGSGTIALDASLSTKFRTTLTASSTMAAFSNPYDGASVILYVRQGGTGSYTLAFDTNVRYTAAVPSITLSTAVGKTDEIGFLYDAIDSMWNVVAFAAAL